MRNRYHAGTLSAAFTFVLLFGQTQSVRAQSDAVTYYVLPDAQFVTEECARLLAAPAPTSPLEKAHDRVQDACNRYRDDHDGDVWAEAVGPAQNELDAFDPDPEHHAGVLLEHRANVPRNASAYVLFLVTSHQLDGGISGLRSAFTDVGDAIGAKNLAVWFEDPHDPDRVDIDHSRWYCDQIFNFRKLGLDYDSGPYVVVTSTRPDTWKTADDIVILKLADISQERIVSLLDALVQEIRTEGHAQRTTLLFREVVARLQSAKDKNPDVFRNISVMILGGKPGS